MPITLPRSIADPFATIESNKASELKTIGEQRTGIESDVSKAEESSKEQAKGNEQRIANTDRRHALEAKETGAFNDLNKFSESAPKPLHQEKFVAPQLDQKAVTAMAMLAGAFAMMGTRKSGQSGKMAVASMAGFFKGLNEGHHEEVQKHFQEYKVNMDNAFREHEELLREYDRIYSQKEKSWQQISREIEHAAVDARDFEKLQEVKENNISKQVNKNNERLDKNEKSRDEMTKFYDGERAKIEKSIQDHQNKIDEQQRHTELMKSLKQTDWVHIGADKDGHEVYVDRHDPTNKFVDTETVMPTKGGKGGAGGGIASMAATRLSGSSGLAAEAIRVLSNLPVETTSPTWGQDSFKGSLFKAPLSVLNQNMSDETSQLMRIRMAGLTRNLASLETGGAATGLQALTEKIDQGVAIPSGAKLVVALDTLAEMRQIVEQSAESAQVNPNMSAEQKDKIKKDVEKVRESIPFTHDDVDKIMSGGISKDEKNISFTDYVKSRGIGKKDTNESTAWTPEKEKRLQELKAKNGT